MAGLKRAALECVGVQVVNAWAIKSIASSRISTPYDKSTSTPNYQNIPLGIILTFDYYRHTRHYTCNTSRRQSNYSTYMALSIQVAVEFHY